MTLVLQVEHSSLASTLTFADDEVVRLNVRPVQDIREQFSQTGSLTVLYLGQERFEFDFSFEMFFRSTVEKLDQIRNIQEPFVIRPFITEAPLSRFTVVWGAQPFREEWILGRRRAQWDFSVTWKEALTGTCPDILFS